MSQLKTQKLNVLTLPLKGIQLIEASAGTGKLGHWPRFMCASFWDMLGLGLASCRLKFW